jgi:hypothetical protein
MTANAIGKGISQKSVISLRCFLERDKFDALLTSCGRPTNRLNPSPLDTDDPSQIERWGNKFGWGIDYANLEAHQQASRDELNEYRREYRKEHREEIRGYHNAKYQAKRAEEGYKVCLLPNGRKVYFKSSAQSITAGQQVNREDQPYYEQDSFREYFENGLVRALREYNSARVGGNLALMSASQLKVFHDCIRMKEKHIHLHVENGSREQLLARLQELGDLNLYFRNSAAMLRTMSLNEAILAIPPRTKLGLNIKEDKELGGVVITKVRETCTFKDIVEIGWRITSIDNVPVWSKENFNAKDPNKLRVMKFAKPIHRNSPLGR